MTTRTYPPTPRLRQHARERCAQRGIRARDAKRAVVDAAVTYPSGVLGRRIAVGSNGVTAVYIEAVEGFAVVETVYPTARNRETER
jgi:hypothetical protein